MNYAHRIVRALSDLPRTLRPLLVAPSTLPGRVGARACPALPRLIMTLLVKNEEAMLEENLRFHHAMGVDGFIVTDNNSTDSTSEILRRYGQLGWVLEVIDEHATDYDQKRWVDRMVLLARERYGADWVINADADEFWYAPQGLKAEIARTRANVLSVEMRVLLPEPGQPWQAWGRTVRPVPRERFEEFDLSPYTVFVRHYKKVMHRTAGYLHIAMGNHKVSMLPHLERRSGVVVYHYNVRDRAAFVEKMVNGGRQLEQHPGRHGGRHWRYYYALWKQGRLEQEYDRVVGTRHLERLAQEGYVVSEPEWPETLAKLTGIVKKR